MNASRDGHFSAEAWEEYARGTLSEEDSEPLEEHLLVCPACQDSLAASDDYIRVVKAAMSGTRSRWSKPVASAVTLASQT
jgi:anti-sigma factor RsiW